MRTAARRDAPEARPAGSEPAPPRPTDALRREVTDGLQTAWDRLGVGAADEGVIGGQLLRPLLATAVARARGRATDDRFWLAALAIQLAHEASLLHDDVVDGAGERRSRPTLVARKGVGAALIAGDQLLARAYLAAAGTGSLPFAQHFAGAIEDTVSGERAQAGAVGRALEPDGLARIARLKSGALFGCAFAAAELLEGGPEADTLDELGRDVGLLYQQVDDLLDFCPGAGTGKPPLADLERDLWTWPRYHLEPGDGPEAFFRRRGARIPALAALEALEANGAGLLSALAEGCPRAAEVHRTVNGWLAAARRAVEGELQNGTVSRPVAPGPASHTNGAGDPEAILAHHGRSFHFATRLMPPEIRGPVSRVYAFCRLVDDAVDRASSETEAEQALDGLLGRARRGYAGAADRIPRHPSGDGAWIARTMQEAREAGVPFSRVEALAEGVRMDLRPRRYADLEDLRIYTHRVAGVVGLWIAGLAGVRDPWALRMADELGHSMQLTNIARDVGADLGMGRIYLPQDLLWKHGLSDEALRTATRPGAPLPPGLPAALEELMGWADAGYGAAFHAIPHLPPGFRRAVAVAARVYQGIHREIRRNGHDTLRRRAYTGRLRKGWLAAGALQELRRMPGPASR